MPKPIIDLTDAQRRQIDESLRKIHDLLPELDKMDRCGIDCQEHREKLRQYERQLTALKIEYPGVK